MAFMGTRSHQSHRAGGARRFGGSCRPRGGRSVADHHRRRLEEVGHRIEEVGAELERKAHRGIEKIEKGLRQAEHRRQRTSERESARRRRRRDARDDESPSKPQRSRRRPPSSPEKEAYRAARERANRKIGVTIHGIAYFSTLALILVATRSIRVTAIVALGWGIGFAIHYFVGVLVPELRERWIREEVAHGVSKERRAVETRHDQSLADLSASVAHEIRNPITAAKSLVQQMGEDPGSGDNIEYAGVALAELDRVERSISHLLRYAREEELRFEDFDMADVVDSALETFRDRIRQQGVDLRVEIDTRGAMNGDAEKMRRVVINLVGNALDALAQGDGEGPRLEIAAGENLAGSEVWLRIRDNGPGIDPETRRKVFDPFFSTKEKGTGLGLALSKKVVDAHGGTLEVDSTTETGTEFLLVVPKTAEGAGGAR
jgi:signal transduction histidine kinase